VTWQKLHGVTCDITPSSECYLDMTVLQMKEKVS
jgi:hypothetical protein